MSGPPAEIVCRDISMVFATGAGPVPALANVTLEVGRGELVALIGPSGCGKSTLLRLIADVLQPTAGAIEVRGGPPRRARLARELGFVFQHPGLLLWRDALANVSLPLTIGGWGRRHEPPHRPEALLDPVGLKGFEHAFPRQLSGGMQQRVSIARALVTGHAIRLWDEPFGALDEITRDHLNQELLRIWAATGTTIIFVTHSIPEAVYLSSRIFVFTHRPGRVLEEVRIDLPSPREPSVKDTPEFVRHTGALRRALARAGGWTPRGHAQEAIGERDGAGRLRHGPRRARGHASPCCGRSGAAPPTPAAPDRHRDPHRAVGHPDPGLRGAGLRDPDAGVRLAGTGQGASALARQRSAHHPREYRRVR